MNTSTLMGASKFVSIMIVTFALATGGMWLSKQPKPKGPGSSPAHWMFWLVGRDLEEELRHPSTPFFEPAEPIVPAWSSGMSEFSRYMQEEQEKRDRMFEEIRAQWGPFDQ